jgi:hypothetical protein
MVAHVFTNHGLISRNRRCKPLSQSETPHCIIRPAVPAHSSQFDGVFASLFLTNLASGEAEYMRSIEINLNPAGQQVLNLDAALILPTATPCRLQLDALCQLH